MTRKIFLPTSFAVLLALVSFARSAQAQSTVTVITAGTPPGGVIPVAAGSIAAAYGTFNGAAAFAKADSLPLPTTLGNARVFANDVASPLQINFQVPLAAPAGIGQGPVDIALTDGSPPSELEIATASTRVLIGAVDGIVLFSDPAISNSTAWSCGATAAVITPQSRNSTIKRRPISPCYSGFLEAAALHAPQ